MTSWTIHCQAHKLDLLLLLCALLMRARLALLQRIAQCIEYLLFQPFELCTYCGSRTLPHSATTFT